MSRALFQAMLRGYRRGQKTRNQTPVRKQRFAPAIEQLDARVLPSVTALFTSGVLSVFGDSTDNTIAISRNAAGTILVNGGAVKVLGASPTVSNTSLIQVFGQSGNDTISLNEANGSLPKANLFGGTGNDTIIGGSRNDQIFGEAGNDTLLGKGGVDSLFGGAGSDTLTGGTGDDQVFGQADNDRMIWNPGEGTDVNEGGAGTDTVEVNGGNGAEQFTVTANGTRVRFDRVNPAPFSLDIGTSESLVVNMNGGDDTFTAGNGLATLITLTVDGGTGNDTITGGDGADSIFGGDGNDSINGGRGNDVVLMGAGDDTFVWNPGDGSDTIEGQDGNDTLLFNGANINEKFDVSANGQRVRFTRDVANIVMDLNGLEEIDVNALGGADTFTINDLTGTALTQFNANLAATGGTGDGSADTVIVNGTNGADNVNVFGSETSASVVGLLTTFNLTGVEGANDSLIVNALGGSDGVTASTLVAGIVKLTVDGGAGDDVILGSRGADSLFGGAGNDFISGGQGNDVVLLGAGDDHFQWSPGEGSDTVEGQDGNDLLMFFGSDVGENFDVSANGGRVRFTRDVGAVTMDLNGIENVELRTLGGADAVNVNDLTGTNLTRFDVDMRGPNGGSDGAVDHVTVNGTQGNDTFGAAGDIGGINVFGLHTVVNIFFQEPTDQLTLNGLSGDDNINAQSLREDSIQFTINAGDGNDTIIGSDGDDTINGGRGNDVALMGAGDDTFVWNPGDGSDTVEGQDGSDTLVFNGANINEKFDLSANGQRVQFTRDVANIVMDLNGLEGIDVNALGGADTFTINDLTGTALTQINANLAATGGTGDGSADTVIVNGTSGDDVIEAAGDASGVSVIGLAATVNITGAEAANDRLVINGLAGDDVINGSGLSADAIQLTADGGELDDVVLGGDGNDVLIGGAGDDVLIGGAGNDVLDGGTGDNILIQ